MVCEDGKYHTLSRLAVMLNPFNKHGQTEDDNRRWEWFVAAVIILIVLDLLMVLDKSLQPPSLFEA